MKIISNAISDTLYQECIEELKYKIQNNNWKSSLLSWSAPVITAVKGSCLFDYVSDNLKNKIIEEIKKYFPENVNKYSVQFYIWTYGAGIPFHDDGHVDTGATIYLNENWSLDYGGIFIWQDKKNIDNYNCLCPTKKTMIINDNTEMHLVTPVLFDSPDFRYTIQIRVPRGEKK